MSTLEENSSSSSTTRHPNDIVEIKNEIDNFLSDFQPKIEYSDIGIKHQQKVDTGTEERFSREFLEQLIDSCDLLCDICDDVNAQRVIKLNNQERFTGGIVLKQIRKIGWGRRRFFYKGVPEQACGHCFRQIVLLSKRLKEKFVERKTKRKCTMDDYPHGVTCQCLNCQSRFGNLGLLVESAERFSSHPTTHHVLENPPSQDIPSMEYLPQHHQQLHDYSNPPTSPYEGFSLTQNAPFNSQPSYSDYSYSLTEPSQPSSSYSMNPYTNYPPSAQSHESHLPVVLQEFENKPSTSSGFSSQSVDEETSTRRTRKVCNHCKKEFSHTGDFRKHLRKHTKEKPFECTQCGKKFSHTSNLHRHVRSHSGDRPYKCEFCSKEFNRKDKLDSHKKSKSCKNRKLSDESQ